MADDSPRWRVLPAATVGGEIVVPGDKSISHRALMLGAVASGTTLIHGFLHSDDCLATLTALAALGVPIEASGPGGAARASGSVRIDGVGTNGLKPPQGVLDLGNSGTAIRLLAGLLAGQRFDSRLTGDRSLRQRPMERVALPLRRMGARIDTDHGRPPLSIRGGAKLVGIDYTLPIASAQVKSALLLAGLSAEGTTTVRSPAPSRDHTERMLSAMGVRLEEDTARHVVSLSGPAGLRGIELTVPGDFSSAAFFVVAGCLAAREGLLIRNVGVNPTRTGLLTILAEMGAQIELRDRRWTGTEPVADIYVRKSDLRAVEVPPDHVSLAIDEFPALFIAAAAATGRTVVRGAAELRQKETDRLAVMARGLEALGADVVETTDGLVVTGGPINGGCVDSEGDHRIAMAFAVASLLADQPIEVLNTDEVATSFPGFVEVAAAAGLRIETARVAAR